MKKMIHALSLFLALHAGLALAGVPFKIATADQRGN